MINYNKLWAILALKEMNKGDLRKAIGCSSDTITAMSNNKFVNLRTIDKICELLDCQPGDILEYRKTEKTVKKTEKTVDK